ncbi:MAG: hypothetical protein CMM64_00120 [Rhodospirillaceae bacterium]|nr:hypothetical protein [Rhodospirillaceae bacterium]|tara:strand:+ start:2862 stop:4091 length:1230 start_codon:yes stop_codon:yes gene_type:complete
MRNFFQFLSEAKQSAASLEAKQKGLVYDSQRNAWINPKTRELVARTEKGKLHFITKRGPGKEDEPSDKRKAAKPEIKAKTTKVAPPKAAPKPAKKEPETQDQDVAVDTLTVAFGRFNPPTVGHGKLLAAAKKAATGGDLKIYPSRTQDPKKNPLDPDMKISFMKKMFPDYSDNIINDDQMKSIFDVLVNANGDYKNVNIVVGSDRQAEFENLATKYNGELYDFENIRVISAGMRDADAAGVEGMSASKMRKAVVDGDFDTFRQGTPKELKDNDTQSLFNAVQSSMKVKAKNKVAEMWEIAPKQDPRGLRENYYAGNVFNLGDIVENLNTGLVGEIVRRGTNHLICVTKENYMFKSWIRDVMEAVVNYPGPSGVPSNEREVGTDSHRKYVMRMTGTTDIKNFINKFKAKK